MKICSIVLGIDFNSIIAFFISSYSLFFYTFMLTSNPVIISLSFSLLLPEAATMQYV